MRAAIIKGPEKLEIVETPMPALRSTQVRVRVEGCGVCASSLPLWEGRAWFRYPCAPGEPGHETWGTIDAISSEARGLRPGMRVATLSLNGFAEYIVVEDNAVVVLPDSLRHCIFPGEAIGCAMNIFLRSGIRPGCRVAIIGIGFLGAVLTQLCVGAGAYVIAISRRAYALELARKCGAHIVLKMDASGGAVEAVRDLTASQLCNRVIEVAGVQDTLDLATELTAEGGHLIVAGYHQDGMRQVNMQLWNWRGLHVINAHERDHSLRLDGIRRAIEAVIDKRLQLDLLGMRCFELDDLNSAFELTRSRAERFTKAVIKM